MAQLTAANEARLRKALDKPYRLIAWAWRRSYNRLVRYQLKSLTDHCKYVEVASY